MRQNSALVPVIAGFGIMLLLLVAVTAIGITHIRNLSHQFTTIISARTQKADYATTMHALHQARYQSLMLAGSLDDAFQRDEEMMRFAQMARDFIQVRDKFLALPLDQKEITLWNTIRSDLKVVDETSGQVSDLLSNDRLVQARRLIRQVLAPRQERMMQAWESMVDLERSKNRLAMSEVRDTGVKVRNLALGLSASAVLVGIVIAVFVVRLSRRLEKDLFEEKEQAQITLQAIGDAVVRFTREKTISYLNPVAEYMLGIHTGKAQEKTISGHLNLFDLASREDLTKSMVEGILGGDWAEFPISACLRSQEGMEYDVEGKCSPIHSEDGSIIGGVLVMRDVTEARELHRILTWQADHDDLTGFYNRRAFEERAGLTLRNKRAGEFPMSLLFIDLDRFKQVNDQAGHAAGDELLRQIARLILSNVRESDLVGRLGGDEFAVMLLSCPDERAAQIADAMRGQVVNFNFAWEGKTYKIGASIGLVPITPDCESLDVCLAAADAACYKAKNNGRNQVVVHKQ